MKHTVNPQIFVNITLVMVAAVLSACANNTQYDNNNAYNAYAYEQPCPCTGQMYVEKVEVNEVIMPAPSKAIAQSTPGGDRAVPVKPKKVAPCAKKETVKEVQPTDVKKKPTPPVEQVVVPAPKAKPVVTEEGMTKTTIVETQEVIKEKPQPSVQPEPAPVPETVKEPKCPPTVEAAAEPNCPSTPQVKETQAEKERLQKEMEALKAEQARLAEEKAKVVKQIEESKKCDEIKDWVATEGSTLRGLLTEWGDEAGWRVVWNMDRDYTLEAGAVFRGRFMDVSAALLRSFARARPAPKGVFYKGNKVLVISTREDENAE